jgi:hypothetical protein
MNPRRRRSPTQSHQLWLTSTVTVNQQLTAVNEHRQRLAPATTGDLTQARDLEQQTRQQRNLPAGEEPQQPAGQADRDET